MKKLFIFMISILLFSCNSLDRFFKLPVEKQKIIIKTEFNNLEKDFYTLLEDKIDEKKREKLEKKVMNLKYKILKVRNFKSEEDKKFIETYSKLTDIKIQYLKDLQDLK